MKDRVEVNVLELLEVSDKAVLKMKDIFNELTKKEEFSDNKELKEMQERLVKVKGKRG